MPDVEVQFGPCCFCGKAIDEGATDPCSVTVETREGLWQTWSCHAACFKAMLVEHPEIDLSPAHF